MIEGGSEHRDRQKSHNSQVEIGNSKYILSAETQKYLTPVYTSKYPSTRSVLIIGEPHSNAFGQMNVYKGIESFFRDNPALIKKTAFLSEGRPANEPISLEPLIKEDPNPKEKLVKQVLASFLITGYMGYEWRYQQGIPILGVEEPRFYKISSALYLESKSNKVLYSTELPKKYARLRPEGKTVEINFEDLWEYIIIARNLSITRILIDTMSSYENPILYVGGGHISRWDDDIKFEIIRGLLPPNIPYYLSPLGEWGSILPSEIENLGIHDILKSEKVGFTFLNFVGDSDKNRESGLSKYDELFRIQEEKARQKYLEHKNLK